MTDFEFGYDDPILGEVSTNGYAHAMEEAVTFNTTAWKKTWKNEEEVNKEIIADFS